jgi:hypothetical protein
LVVDVGAIIPTPVPVLFNIVAERGACKCCFIRAYNIPCRGASITRNPSHNNHRCYRYKIFLPGCIKNSYVRICTANIIKRKFGSKKNTILETI